MKRVHHCLQIRTKHRYGFRSGEWADLVGFVIVEPEQGEPRGCYMVAFPDGATDYWAVSEEYDMRPADKR